MITNPHSIGAHTTLPSMKKFRLVLSSEQSRYVFLDEQILDIDFTKLYINMSPFVPKRKFFADRKFSDILVVEK